MNFTKLIPLVLCSALVFSSCDDDDDNVIEVPAVVENNFTRQYPDALAVEWETDNQYATPYMKAEFTMNGTEYEAWYNYDGVWMKTESDYTGQLPEAVNHYISANFPSYYVDETKWVESPKHNFFEVELKNRDHEVEISILEDGTVLHIEDSENHVPNVVVKNFAEKYPEVKVKEWEKEGALWKAEFVMNNVESEAWFTYNGIWVKTETDFAGNLPQAVTDYISTYYVGYKIDDITWIETPEQNYFEIELEKENTDIELSIQEDGTFIKAIPAND